jgi:DNA replication licensing factor MCM2
LPPSSPPAPFSDTDESADDGDAIRNVDDDEDDEGEDLFADNVLEE